MAGGEDNLYSFNRSGAAPRVTGPLVRPEDVGTLRLGPLAPQPSRPPVNDPAGPVGVLHTGSLAEPRGYTPPPVGRGADAEAFASSRVALAPGASLNNARTMADYTAMRDALRDLYALGLSDPDRVIGGPLYSMTAGEALKHLRTTNVHIGSVAGANDRDLGAATYRGTPTAPADVYIDPFHANVDGHRRRYSEGSENYAPFHELAHAIWSGRKASHWVDGDREVIGNGFGGDLARAVGRPYPSFEELPREKPGPMGWKRR